MFVAAYSSPSSTSSYLAAFFFQIKYGGVVPKSFYIKDSVDVQYEKCITINRGTDHQLEFEVLIPNCLLRWVINPLEFFHLSFLFLKTLFIHSFMFNSRWQFASDGSDIGFGIYLKPKAGVKQKIAEMQEVLPTTRYNAHLVPEDGSYTCEEPGICTYKLCKC